MAASSTSFKPGQVANPAGRPKGNPAFKMRCRTVVDSVCFDAWKTEVENKGDNWVKCSELLAAYGYGKPGSADDAGDGSFTMVDGKRLSFEELKQHNAIATAARAQLDESH